MRLEELRSDVPPRRRAGFTLVELLVVIGIIALLISILLPTLSRARAAASSVACKSLLRQYALAADVYALEYKGTNVDVYMFLDYGKGLLKYLNQKNEMGDKVGRCPADSSTEQMGRLGEIGNTANTLYQITNAKGLTYIAKVSIGANENCTSASLFPGPAGTTTQKWIKRTQLRGFDTSRTMTWADYQNNREAGDKNAPTVGLGVASTTTANDKMGSVVFRHGGAFNAAFMDGHVGEVRTKKKITASGHDLAPGENWGTFTSVTPNLSFGSYASHKVFYPFAPGAYKGTGYAAFGTIDNWEIK